MLQIAAVSPTLLQILTRLMRIEELDAFRLVGGTALALQMGHRISVDIDLFTDKPFDKTTVIRAISAIYQPQLISQNAVGITLFIQDVKVDICNWSVPFVGQLLENRGIRMASPEDIAALKLDAITDRKEQKDFYDLFFLLQQFSVEQLLRVYRLKYPYNNVKDVFAAIASISQADVSPTPVLSTPLEWSMVKDTISNLFDAYISAAQSLKDTAERQRWEAIRTVIERKNKRPD